MRDGVHLSIRMRMDSDGVVYKRQVFVQDLKEHGLLEEKNKTKPSFTATSITTHFPVLYVLWKIASVTVVRASDDRVISTPLM